ncbi:MAG: signal recognition particle subunit SRP19/SEC65 family protein [Candidatus Bathyarchaeia archaeon]
MQRQKKTILWPVYFDSSKTRKEGRKVSRNVAVPNPNLSELQRAAERLGLKPETELDVAHPAIPWRKTGRIWVQKTGTKAQTLMKIAKELVDIHQQTKN